MKKIAIITKNFEQNGISAAIFNEIKNQSPDKFSITIIIRGIIEKDYYKLLAERNISVIQLKSINTFKYIIELKKVLKANGYSAIHIHGNSSAVTKELLAGKMAGIKKRIVHSHNTTCNHPIIHFFTKWMISALATHRVSCSKAAGKWMFGRKSFRVIPNGIDLENFRFNKKYRHEIRKKLNLKDELLIGHVGKFNNQKNQIYLLNLIKNIKKSGKSIKLCLIGDGVNKNRVLQAIRDNSLESEVILLGELSGTNKYYNAFDLFIMPSRYEGLPLVAIEAQANGLPVFLSTKITKEAKKTETVSYFSLRKNKLGDLSYLIEKTINLPTGETEREQKSKENIEMLMKEGYNLENTTKIIEELYA